MLESLVPPTGGPRVEYSMGLCQPGEVCWVRMHPGGTSVPKSPAIFTSRRPAGDISKNIENIALHKHLQSHLSFAYYLKKKDTDANLLFIDEVKHNEFLPGMFLSPTTNKKQVKTFKKPINTYKNQIKNR